MADKAPDKPAAKKYPVAGDQVVILGTVLRTHHCGDEFEPSYQMVEIQCADQQHIATNLRNVGEAPKKK